MAVVVLDEIALVVEFTNGVSELQLDRALAQRLRVPLDALGELLERLGQRRHLGGTGAGT